jgi:hypothetical protein
MELKNGSTLGKNGQTHYREADGSLWLAESFLNTETQEVISTASFVEPAPEPEPAPWTPPEPAPEPAPEPSPE